MAENNGRPPRVNPQGPTRDNNSIRDEVANFNQHADLALRVAWLRVHGHHMFDLDPTGQTSAQLWDFADLLEALDAEGRWSA